MPTLIKNRYVVVETLGAGGEARVVKALDQQHDRVVALKIREVPDNGAREELLGEARVLLAVPPHPALPLVREDFFDDDRYIVAMDWVEGTDLARVLRAQGRPGLSPSSVMRWLSDAASALTHLHTLERPVIHSIRWRPSSWNRYCGSVSPPTRRGARRRPGSSSSGSAPVGDRRSRPASSRSA